MKTLLLVTAIMSACSVAMSAGSRKDGRMGGSVYSGLWGQDGEERETAGRLPDFSFAGYACGEAEIPTLQATANVRQFGAKGDGTHDDTEAFKEAIEKTDKGAILIPPGKYVLTDFITINKPNLVLRGAGPDKTVLYFPKPLTDVKPNWGATTTGQRTSNYSWSGGYLVLDGRIERKKLADITAVEKRGDTILRLSSTEDVKKGQWVEIEVKDDKDKTLTSWLYSDDPGNMSKIRASSTRQVARVLGVKGDRIKIDRPLRVETRPEWTPRLNSFDPAVVNSGIEDLTCEFPPVQWNGEFRELGYNAIDLRGVAHCWVRNIHLLNAEGGIFSRAVHCTISDIRLSSEKPPFTGNKYRSAAGCNGHHGISIYGSDHLVTGFDFQVNYVHDLSVEGSNCGGNVFANGRGNDLCFDHHKRGPHANLFTQIDCGAGNRIWRCGGGANLGRHCAGWTVFWNLTADKPLSPPPAGWGPATLSVVGMDSQEKSQTDPGKMWFEPIDPDDLRPPNLHSAQLAERLDTR
jgi:hypothetical protein